MNSLFTESELLASAQPYEPVCGIYFLFQSSNLVYVGQSVDIHARLSAHVRKKEFDRYTVIPCQPDQLNEMEADYIVYFNPPLNRSLPENLIWMTRSGIRRRFPEMTWPAIKRYMRENNVTDTNGFYRVADFGMLSESQGSS